MRHFIENHFGFVLILACAAGLVVPGLPALPDSSATLTLAMLTFVSCYKLRGSRFHDIRIGDTLLFYALRYIVLPVALYTLALSCAPTYATGVFLLSLVPSAVSSPAFCTIFGGRVPHAFAIVILSTLLSPVLIPLQFAWVGGDSDVMPDPVKLFQTLVWCVLVPMLAYAAVRNHANSRAFIEVNNKLISILLVAFIIALVIAKQRGIILSDIPALAEPFLLVIASFACFLLFGWYFAARRNREERITYAVCSGFNNAALGVSLALLHFPAAVVLFVAVSEIGWALLPWMVKAWIKLSATK